MACQCFYPTATIIVISQISCIVEVKLAKTKMELAAVEMEAKTVAPRHRC